MLFRLLDLPELSPNEFQVDKSIGYQRIGTPAHLDLASGVIKVDEGFLLVGWCRKMHAHVMHGREGQIGLMFFHPAYDEVWEHYPLYNQDDYADAKLEARGVV